MFVMLGVGENITLFLDTQEYLSTTQKHGYAFLADWEKAYDRIDRDFIAQSLTAFGFGPSFCRWFRLLHKHSSAQVIVNGFLTENFAVDSGVRQGCPWAPFLFLLGVEPLACALRQEPSIKGIKLPNGKRILYSGYADDTTLYVSDLQDLDRCIAVFDTYSKCSGMKLNLLKSTVVPLGSASLDGPPANFLYKWLNATDTESLLGVPVTLDYDPDSAWSLMIEKLAKSIKHWSAQRLSVFGRVHAARSYIGSKSWYLASMIPPAPKCLKRLTSMLWRFLQRNAETDLTVVSNRYYSPWSKAFLAQPLVRGGLNVQHYELQLTATLAKWIFKLIDPRHIASWKAFPFYFFDKRFPGLGPSIFIADPIITKSFGCTDGRWFGFLRSWLLSGSHVSKPPKDYLCILNESLWFNRHMQVDPYRNKRGRSFCKSTEDRLIQFGFTHVSSLISSTQNDPDKLYFLSYEESMARTGSRVLADAIKKIIYDRLPFGWTMIVHRKIREPFQVGDWFIDQSAADVDKPATVYRVSNVAHTLILGEAYSMVNCETGLLLKSSPIAIVLLPVCQIIKACVLICRKTQFYYYGDYTSCRLLLSRISWTCPNFRDTQFQDFSVRTLYRAIIGKTCQLIPAISRWNRILSFSIDNNWKSMIRYIHDPIFNNRTKETLYKLYTQVLPVGTNIERFAPNNCCFCDDVESEFHLFIHCPRVLDIWTWLQSFILIHYDNLSIQGLSDWEKLIGYNRKMPTAIIQVWKLFHAETIRSIWSSRCKLVFEGESLDIPEIKAQVISRVEYSMTIWANVLQLSGKASNMKILRKIVRLWTVKIPVSVFEQSVKGYWKCKVQI